MPFAVVAIPNKDDYIWNISSEKVPHLTILYLGDKLDNVSNVEKYLSHAVDTSLRRFGLSVMRRGELGSDKADVVFFNKYGTKTLSEFRSYLLRDSNISQAYLSMEQYPEWTPHLTLGYPTSPAKPDNRDYPGIHWIEFDKIALWTGDFTGPEFELKDYEEMSEALEMANTGRSFLEHFGIKGMKWGVRRNKTSVDVRSEDVKNTDRSKATIRKHGTKALSTGDLQRLVTRMNLEQQYSQLRTKEPNKITTGHAAVKQILGVAKTGVEVYTLFNSTAGKAAILLGSQVVKGVMSKK